jgi:NADH dehydrogenase
MRNVHTVIHLAAARRFEGEKAADWIDHEGAAHLVEAALDTDVERIIYLSYMHADRSSAYPALRSKGAAEATIRNSGLAYTILRTSLVFGPDDAFTTLLAMLIKVIPLVFPVTGDGKTRFQPIHLDDVAACLAGSLDAQDLINVTLPIGGPQHLSYTEILDAVTKTMRVRRIRIHLRLPLMRTLVNFSASLFPFPPVSRDQLDLFCIDNTTDLGNVPRHFNLEPRRFADNLDHLIGGGWRRAFLQYVREG